MVILAAIALIGAGAQVGRAAGPRVQKGVVEFTDSVKLYNVFLTGEYLLVPDEYKMANGEACTSVYE